MSRRPNAAADKAAANQQVIKSLLKLPGNKFCADCKRNKLPRWASWNLGIFICIRCSGIHRGMGTHISRVKSVDLDTWTDEQLQSMLKWGNSKANKYWEANLAPGHIPSEAKIENFVRTKYETKRWVMEGSIPDPATLDDSGDEEDLPLKVVQQKLENRQPQPAPSSQPQPKQSVNLFDDDDGLFHGEPPKTSSAPPTGRNTQPPPKGTPAPPKSTKPADSLLGLDLDFFGATPSPVPRPASTGPNPTQTTSSSRPDLNRSILSLYASAPKPQQIKPSHSSSPSFSSPAPTQPQTTAFGELSTAFGGLSFGPTQTSAPSISTQSIAATSSQTPQKPSPFANLTAGMSRAPAPAAPQLSATSTTGGFFGPTHSKSSSGSLSKATGGAVSSSTGLNDLFDFGAPAPTTTTSAPSPQPQSQVHKTTPQFSFDTNAWATPTPMASTAATTNSAWASASSGTWGGSGSGALGGLGVVKPEEDEWGSFNSGGVAAVGAKPVGMGLADDDLFGNAWK
ncbi:ARF GAP with effector function(s) [Rhizina undulata]